MLLSLVTWPSANPVWSANLEIEDLIQQLDAPKFVLREDATNQLVNLGQSVLQPVAVHFLDASPEAQWRIKRILETMGTEADDEETSLKAIGVLILLDHEIDGELAGLLRSWRENRSMRAIEYLVSKGASVRPVGWQQNMVIRRPVEIGNRVPASNDLRNRSKPTRRLGQLPREKAREEIDAVVEGSFKEVQKFVFARLPADSPSEFPRQADQVMRQLAMGGLGPGAAGSATLIEFRPGWEGTAEDLQRLKEIHTLQSIFFDQQNLTAEDMDVISELKNIQHVSISETSFQNGPLASFRLPASVESIELKKLNLDQATMKWLSRYPLENLVIDECQLDGSSRSGLSSLEQLISLELRRMRITRSLFRELKTMPELSQVILSVCKFEPKDYKEFVADLKRGNRRNRTNVEFNSVSFLGVQAPRDIGGDPSEWTCRISMVVPDSSADKAGIKAGDVITAVNGYPIELFEELRMHISQHDVGEQLEIEILRGDEQLKLKATLGGNRNIPIR